MVRESDVGNPIAIQGGRQRHRAVEISSETDDEWNQSMAALDFNLNMDNIGDEPIGIEGTPSLKPTSR